MGNCIQTKKKEIILIDKEKEIEMEKEKYKYCIQCIDILNLKNDKIRILENQIYILEHR